MFLYCEAQNKLTALSGMEDKPSLAHINARDNTIADINIMSNDLPNLSYLNLRNNMIDNFGPVDVLSKLMNLRSLSLSGNPVEQLPNYRMEVLMRIVQLTRFDKQDVNEEERQLVDEYRIKVEQDAEERRLNKIREEEIQKEAEEKAALDAENAALEALNAPVVSHF